MNLYLKVQKILTFFKQNRQRRPNVRHKIKTPWERLCITNVLCLFNFKHKTKQIPHFFLILVNKQNLAEHTFFIVNLWVKQRLYSLHLDG